MNSPPNFETTPPPEAAPVQLDRCPAHGCPLEPVTHSVTTSRATLPAGLGWSCPRCDEETQVRAVRESHQQHDAERRRAAAAIRQSELAKRIGAACIPARYRDFTFETFRAPTPQAERAVTVMRNYALRWKSVAPRGISMLLHGGTGTGKTGLACSVANRIVADEHATALFITAYGAVRHQRDTWGRKGRRERDALDDLLDPDLLILDEVGAAVGSDVETAMLFEVINGRYAARKPTFLLSNLPMDDYQVGNQTRVGLRTVLGPRVIDRFRDDGSVTIAFDWPSLRGTAA